MYVDKIGIQWKKQMDICISSVNTLNMGSNNNHSILVYADFRPYFFITYFFTTLNRCCRCLQLSSDKNLVLRVILILKV